MWTKAPDLVPNRVWIHWDSKTLIYNEINSLRPREGSPAVAFPPPLARKKAFSCSGRGRIFSFFGGYAGELKERLINGFGYAEISA